MAAPIRIGEEVELRIDSLAYGGNGVGRLDGFVVFVRGGLPGDVVRARATKVKRGFAEATRVAVREAGQTVRDISGAHVIEMSAVVENDSITMFRTTVDIAFGVER